MAPPGTGSPVTVDEQRALAFRARRHHLLGPGADTAAAAARAVVGIQAQVVAPALWSLAMRTSSRPTAAALEQQLHSGPDLVRTWGQRGTVHLYDAEAHWAPVIALCGGWPIGLRPGRQPDTGTVDAAHERARTLGRPMTRSDLFDLVPPDYVEWMATRTGPGTPALRGAAGRVLAALVDRGLLSAHATVDGEQSYILREERFPHLEWRLPDPLEAATKLVRDYLAANAPATVQDVAHFLGARVSDARTALEPLERELVGVDCGDRAGLLALRSDVADLAKAAPRSWPVRLLPRFDTLLMAHRDKSWTVPTESDRPLIWAKAAQVRATVLHRGRLVATWDQRSRAGKLTVVITPLSGWTDGLESELEPDAAALAAHLGLREAETRVG